MTESTGRLVEKPVAFSLRTRPKLAQEIELSFSLQPTRKFISAVNWDSVG